MPDDLTPGRWEAIETAGLWVVTSHEPALSATCIRIVATAWQGAADARLIAEAKELIKQIETDRDRFRSFARYARDSGWCSTAEEFDRFAADADKMIAKAGGREG